MSKDLKSTFNLPDITNILNIPQGTIPCRGNGYTLGVTNGRTNYGLAYNTSGFILRTNAYNVPVSVNGSSSDNPPAGSMLGVVNDSDKSGIVADFSSETITCKYIIKY